MPLFQKEWKRSRITFVTIPDIIGRIVYKLYHYKELVKRCVILDNKLGRECPICPESFRSIVVKLQNTRFTASSNISARIAGTMCQMTSLSIANDAG
ncbi:hypothetical protein AVEN_228754-1 [Araneus ventricosus]|uniref:Uncharacterized protein n=1 Tax=Araneus ventricosus TaxID=182803 RepID=A0A4Y2GKW8_ARAVE|nr:hypothetical protein AVEN_228754-1 [Araneus ventricosus]